jgi:Recombination enhancement, RecA-dependent nuclease
MATAEEKRHMNRVASLGCILCGAEATIHHCGTYMGGGRNHKRVIPLCWDHHLGPEGIEGKRMGKRVWEMKYGTEEELFARTVAKLKKLDIMQGRAIEQPGSSRGS